MKNILTTLFIIAAFQAIPFNNLQAQDWLWANALGGTSDDHARAVVVDSSNNVYVTGSYQGSATFGATVLNSSGDLDIYLAKYDADGNALWAVTAGGIGADEGKELSLDASGNIYVTGTFTGLANFEASAIISAGDLDVFLAKYDTNGNLLAVTNARSSTTEDLVAGISNTTDGAVYLTGTYDVGVNANDIYLAKYDDISLSLTWTALAGGPGFQSSAGVAVDGTGDAYISGHFGGTMNIGGSSLVATANNDLFVAKYLADGSFSWVSQVEILGFAQMGGIDTDSFGNAYIVGYFDFSADFGTLTVVADSEMEALYAKFNTNGIVQWADRSDNAGFVTGRAITTDPAGNSYIGGDLEAFNAFGSLNLASIGEDDSYVVKLDSDGVPLWGKNIAELENGGFHFVEDIALDNNGDSYTVGDFTDEIGFDGISLLPTPGGSDGFLGKIGTASCPDLELTLSTSNITGESATITWEGLGASEFQYRYGIPGGAFEPLVTTTATSVVLTGLNSGTEYLFRIRALCDGLVVDLNTVQFTTLSESNCLDAPENVIATNITSTSVTLAWDAADSTDLLDYSYRYRTGGGSWITGSTITPVLALTGLNSSSTYEFVVLNRCQGGNSLRTRIFFTTASASLSLAPNPVSRTLQVVPSETMLVQVFDLSGVLKREYTITPDGRDLDLADLKPGMYIVKGLSETGSFTERLIKE